MYIVVWLWLLLVIIVIICLIFVIIHYNRLQHLSKTCINTLEIIVDTWQKKSASLDDVSLQELIAHCSNAKTNDTQIKWLNKLIAYSASVPNSPVWKKIQNIDASLSTEKRFYTNTARELNDRLATFPGSIIGSIIGIKELWLITLNEKESEWILPEAKYL